MKRDEVRLGKQLQAMVLTSIVATLLNDGIEVLVVSLDDHHLHVLARFMDRQPRGRVGWAKQRATKTVKRFMEVEQTHGSAVVFQLDLKLGEGLWAKRGKENPVKDREHQLNCVEYIADHGKRGVVSPRQRRPMVPQA